MRDRGSASVELVLLTPMLVVLILFVVHAGRSATAMQQIRHAADQGARAASLMSGSRQQSAAVSAVTADLRRSGVGCDQPSVALTTGRVGRVRTVRVTVACGIEAAGLTLLQPSGRRIQVTSTEPIDVYRGGT
jgi:Flp pilus assembly protein TadG